MGNEAEEEEVAAQPQASTQGPQPVETTPAASKRSAQVAFGDSICK